MFNSDCWCETGSCLLFSSTSRALKSFLICADNIIKINIYCRDKSHGSSNRRNKLQQTEIKNPPMLATCWDCKTGRQSFSLEVFISLSCTPKVNPTF